MQLHEYFKFTSFSSSFCFDLIFNLQLTHEVPRAKQQIQDRLQTKIKQTTAAYTLLFVQCWLLSKVRDKKSTQGDIWRLVGGAAFGVFSSADSRELFLNTETVKRFVFLLVEGNARSVSKETSETPACNRRIGKCLSFRAIHLRLSAWRLWGKVNTRLLSSCRRSAILYYKRRVKSLSFTQAGEGDFEYTCVIHI